MKLTHTWWLLLAMSITSCKKDNLNNLPQESRLPAPKWAIYNTGSSQITDDPIKAVAVDNQVVENKDDVWAGAYNRPFHYSQTHWQEYTSENSELPHNEINCVNYDETHLTIWPGTEFWTKSTLWIDVIE